MPLSDQSMSFMSLWMELEDVQQLSSLRLPLIQESVVLMKDSAFAREYTAQTRPFTLLTT